MGLWQCLGAGGCGGKPQAGACLKPLLPNASSMQIKHMLMDQAYFSCWCAPRRGCCHALAQASGHLPATPSVA